MNAAEFFGIQCPAMFKSNGELDGSNNVVRLALDMCVDDAVSPTLSDDSEQRHLLREQFLSEINKVRMGLRQRAMAVYGD